MQQKSGLNSTSLDELIRSITGKRSGPKECLFLKLPIEIRQYIYQLVLPQTTVLRNREGVAHVWVRGNTSILATCHQVHEEAANFLYGESVFLVEVGFDTIVFRQRHIIRGTSLTPQATPSFLDLLAPNIHRIRHIAIRVDHVDSYTGKYPPTTLV